jgi:hypothetical protein
MSSTELAAGPSGKAFGVGSSHKGRALAAGGKGEVVPDPAGA